LSFFREFPRHLLGIDKEILPHQIGQTLFAKSGRWKDPGKKGFAATISSSMMTHMTQM